MYYNQDLGLPNAHSLTHAANCRVGIKMNSDHHRSEKYCHSCGVVIDSRAEICPKCGVRQQVSDLSPAAPAAQRSAHLSDANGKKLAAGIIGIILGWLGIHKFILGYSTPGIIMLLVSILTCGWGAIPMAIIGLVEGIVYLVKSDEEFYRIYIQREKHWF